MMVTIDTDSEVINLDIWALLIIIVALAILPIMYGIRYVVIEKKA